MINSLLLKENPREKLFKYGSSTLTDVELLALVLRHGGKDMSVLELSRKILREFGTLENLVSADISELISYSYIGQAKAASIKAFMELALRINNPEDTRRTIIKNPKDVYKIIRKDIYKKKQEYLYLISLDNKNVVTSKNLISLGTINETVIHPREIFHYALKNKAVSIILVHNHPSGDTTPSKEDIEVTIRVQKAGRIIGIPLLDHVILSNSDFLSMKEKKLLIHKDLKGGDHNEK